MASFTTRIPNLQGVGPIVDVDVGIAGATAAALKKAGAPITSPITLRAMIDTGASRTVIQKGVAGQLGIHPVGTTAINTPSSSNVPCNEYLIRLLFPGNVVVETVAVEAPLKGQHIQALIGREVLAHGVLIYNGYDRSFTLSF